jgi:hypothetical protein
MLTFEANPYLGTANIVKKLQELPFAKVTHQVHTLDAQPSNSSNPSIIVLVTGALKVGPPFLCPVPFFFPLLFCPTAFFLTCVCVIFHT